MKNNNKVPAEKRSLVDFGARDYILFIVLGFVAAVIPLVVKLEYVPLAPEEFEFIRNGVQIPGIDGRVVADFFSYYKSMLLTICFVGLCIFFGINTYFDFGIIKFKESFKNPILISALIFIVCAALSAGFSSYKYVSVHGISSRYEGLFILVGYMLLLFATMNFAKGKLQVRLIFYAVCFSALVIGLISLTQLLDMDFFLSESGSKLIMGEYYGSGVSQSAVFTMVYATLFNPNCVGLYTAMIIPVTLSAAIFYDRKSPFKYFLFVLTALLFAALLGSSNVGGFVATAFTSGLAVIIGLVVTKRRRPEKLPLYSGLIIGLMLTAVALILFVPYLRAKTTYVIEKVSSQQKAETYGRFKDLKIDGDQVQIIYDTGQLTISVDEAGKFEVTSADGTLLEPVSVLTPEEAPDGRIALFKDPGLGEFRLNLVENAFSFDCGGFQLVFAKMPDGSLSALSSKFIPVDINQPVPRLGFEGNELFASSRGYIWSRSIPLLKDTIFVGSGPDTFVLKFPQDDIMGKLRYFNDPYIIVDKPHNFYLQTAINTGLVSLGALLFIFAFYILQSLKVIATCFDEDMQVFGFKVGIFLGICGYLVAALATDSVVSVAPVFWILLGLGFAVNKYSAASCPRLRIVK